MRPASPSSRWTSWRRSRRPFCRGCNGRQDRTHRAHRRSPWPRAPTLGPAARSSPLRPVRLARRIADDDVLEERDRLLETLVARHDAVLVLDAEHVVVADEAQVRDDVLPDDRVVSVAARPEDP